MTPSKEDSLNLPPHCRHMYLRLGDSTKGTQHSPQRTEGRMFIRWSELKILPCSELKDLLAPPLYWPHMCLYFGDETE